MQEMVRETSFHLLLLDKKNKKFNFCCNHVQIGLEMFILND